MSLHIDHVVTSGVFSLDGEDFEVDNNIWLIGDDHEVLVVDAADDHRPILDAVAGRTVLGIVCSHAHNDHINAAAELSDSTGAPILLHPDDSMLWEAVYPDRKVDTALHDGDSITVGDDVLGVIHTPGHSPGGVCLYVPSLATLFSGDTLFDGGPGATGRSFSDRGQLEASIVERLFVLPPNTTVKTGHGGSTTVRVESERSATW